MSFPAAPAARSPVSREPLFAFACLLLTFNALPTFFGQAVSTHGQLGALFALYDVSAIVWLAIAAGAALLWQPESPTPVRRGDGAMLLVAVLAALPPLPALSSAALTCVAAWGIFSSSPRSALRRGCVIFLSVTAFLLWGRIFLAVGAGPLLRADAAFVSLLSGMPSTGNSVNFSNGSQFVIAPGCSSLHGISLALVLWTTAINYFEYRLTRRLWVTLGLAIAASIVVNGARLSMIAFNPDSYQYWHHDDGALLFGWIGLFAVVGVIYRGIDRAPRLA